MKEVEPVTFLELFTLFVSAVTIFGLIVGVFLVYNGRMTRREITSVIHETQQLIARETEATRQLIRETHEATRQILQGITEILARIDERVR